LADTTDQQRRFAQHPLHARPRATPTSSRSRKLADPGAELDKERGARLPEKDGEPGYADCSDRRAVAFPRRLVLHRRGRNEALPPRPVEKRISNNLVLRSCAWPSS
jgi:uncharacterized protein YehS (DUF1456 family)